MDAQGYNMRYNASTSKVAVAASNGGKEMSVLKVTTVGNSVGVILPKELLERLRVGRGDSLYVIETKNGIELTAYNPEFAQQVEVAERVMREDRDALKKLAE
jgi:putative addiction module antidote